MRASLFRRLRPLPFVPAMALALLLALAALAAQGPDLAHAAEAFDPNTVTCDQVMRGSEDLQDLATLFTYAFLSGIDFAQGLPVSALDRETYQTTRAALENLCRDNPEYSLLRMIRAGLEGKPASPAP